MPTIHRSAIVHEGATLAEGVSVGPFSIIDEDVEIGEGTQIHSHVRVANGARIGENCQVHHGAVVATLPQDIKFSGEKTILQIGDNTIIREYCTLNRGTADRKMTRIGNDCYLMAYAHVAHDCYVGQKVILANGVQLAGHVTIEDWVIIGGLVPVHQFTRIGQHAIIGGNYRAVQDVPPYILAAGEPLAYKGLNVVGLKRRGFSEETRRMLKQCYRILYRSQLNKSQAIERIKAEIEMIPEVENVVEFVENSERGLI